MSFTKMASLVRSVACVGLLLACPSAARAQAPPVDPFLGVSILTTGAAAPGGAVTLDNTIDRTVAGGVNQNQPGLSLTNLIGGYDDSVLDPIRNFSAAPLTKPRQAASVPTSACVNATLAPAASSSAATR